MIHCHVGHLIHARAINGRSIYLTKFYCICCVPWQVFSTSKTLDGIETLEDDEDSDWLGEYQRGCDWEIYTTELSR